ncbi:hypothetical protein Tco_0089765 [Tanacetum coccineum]
MVAVGGDEDDGGYGVDDRLGSDGDDGGYGVDDRLGSDGDDGGGWRGSAGVAGISGKTKKLSEISFYIKLLYGSESAMYTRSYDDGLIVKQIQ